MSEGLECKQHYNVHAYKTNGHHDEQRDHPFLTSTINRTNPFLCYKEIDVMNEVHGYECNVS